MLQDEQFTDWDLSVQRFTLSEQRQVSVREYSDF